MADGTPPCMSSERGARIVVIFSAPSSGRQECLTASLVADTPASRVQSVI